MSNQGKFKVGTAFTGNINGRRFVVDAVTTDRNGSKMYVVRDLADGKHYSLADVLIEHLDVTIEDEGSRA